MGRNLLLSLLWIGGMTPTAICLLIVVAMAGKPVECKSADCANRTYGWDLLILPAGTLAPFMAGYAIARIRAQKRRFDAVSRAIFEDTPNTHFQPVHPKSGGSDEKNT